MLGHVCQLLMSGMCRGAAASTQWHLELGHFLFWTSYGQKVAPLSYCHILGDTGFSLQRGLECLVILRPQHP